MPTMNKTDLMDCANGSHSYAHGGEHGDPCTVCGHVEPYSIGVDVWMCGTIYVAAESEEAAAAIVAERYAGGRDDSRGYDHMSGNDLPMDGDDFMSSAMTLYGIAGKSKLVPEADPVRDAAPDMLAALKALIEHAKDTSAYEDARAGEDPKMMEAVNAAEAAVAKAEGGAA